MKNNILDEIKKNLPALTALRQDLHMHPELGFEEVRTSEIVSKQLASLGIHPKKGMGKTGVVGVIEGTAGQSDRIVGLRADMDALPLHENTGLPFQSKIEGKMHGCGHDGHTTMLLGAARYLSENRHLFSGSILLIFQPGEEGHAGARAMIEDGLFREFPVDSVYALHNWPSLQPGSIGINEGPMMAGIDTFELRIIGRGGHGGHPENAIDASLVASQIVTSLQSIIGRNLNPLQSGTIGIHSVQAGEPGRLSVIPAEAVIHGMTKWYDSAVQQILRDRLEGIARSTAEAYGAQAELSYQPLYPPTINSRAQTQRVIQTAESLVGKDNIIGDLPPSMGSEDFAFMLLEKPGAYFRLGQGSAEDGFLHSPTYEFNDDVIPIGAAMLAQIAVDDLADMNGAD